MARKAIDDIVNQLCSVESRKSWFDSLTEEQQKICREVRQKVKAEGLPKHPVAKNIISQFHLKVLPRRVVDWFERSCDE